MKKILTLAASIAAAFTVGSCTKQVTVDALVANFTVSDNPCYAGDEIKFTSTTMGGKQPYSYSWNVEETELVKYKDKDEAKYSFPTNGTFAVSLTVKDDMGNTSTKRKLVVVNPAVIEDKGSMEVLWAKPTEQYNSISSPAVDDEGNVYGVTRANKMWKFDKTGKQLWVKQLFTGASGSVTYGTPSIDTDGTIFIGGGSVNGDAHVLALNSSDGSEKWSFNEWWNNGNTPAPSYQHAIIGIGDENVYFGCTGGSGIIVSANKATGKRKGFTNPAGGVRSGVVLTSDGYVAWNGGNYGYWGIKQSVLDNGGDNKVSTQWSMYNNTNLETASTTFPNGGIACLTVNGKPCIAAVMTDKSKEHPTRVFVLQADGGETGKGLQVASHRVMDCGAGAVQDQGGVVVTEEGYIVAALNFSTGQNDGGIIVIDPKTADAEGQCKVIGRFSVQEKVSGSPAVDKAGNIHFGTESGHYYVVDKNINLIVKADIAAAARQANPDAFENVTTSKVWSSVIIGDDGTVYASFTDANDNSVSGIMAFVPKNNAGTAFCEGPADSEWPMYGQNRRHTNRMK